MTAIHPPGAAAARARRLAANAASTLLACAFALNLSWEMWSETGIVGVVMNLSMALFSVPGRWLVYMLLPWAHVAVAVVSCTWLHRAIAGRQARTIPARPRADGGGAGLFLLCGLMTMVVACSFAGLMYLGERQIEAANDGQPVQDLTVDEVTNGRRLDARVRLPAVPRAVDVLRSWPLHRKSTAKLTLYVPLVAGPGNGAPLRVALRLEQPLRQTTQPRDWAPPYAVQRIFAPVPTWVRGEWERRGLRLAPDAVLVQRVWLDAEGRPLETGLSALAVAMAVAGVGVFCGLVLIGLDFLMRTSARSQP